MEGIPGLVNPSPSMLMHMQVDETPSATSSPSPDERHNWSQTEATTGKLAGASQLHSQGRTSRSRWENPETLRSGDEKGATFVKWTPANVLEGSGGSLQPKVLSSILHGPSGPPGEAWHSV